MSAPTTMKPLFLPLVGEHYDHFERVEKPFEFRRYKAPWTEENCVVGREAILSRGYGEKHRLRGVITSFEHIPIDMLHPIDRMTFIAIYPNWDSDVAVIGIKVLGAV